jgi:PAS domain S-box-containing protein
VHWSDELFRIAGYEPGSFKPEPETWLKLVHTDDLHAMKSNVDRARTSGGEYHHRYRVQRQDGTIRWLESQGKSQRDSEGRIIRLMGVIADVTQRVHAEEGMLRAEKLAVAGRLAASVAHEINNPLEAVANMLYLITMSDTLESAHEHAARALDELMRISLIAQSTLKFHRQTGSPQLTLLSEVLETVLTLFKGKLGTMQIAVRLQAEDEVPISCMPGEAQQIFANLVSNAVEAMQPNGRLLIRIRPSLDWRNGTTQGMRVTIWDSGAGIDRATMRRIFEPFYTTKPDTGTGLGLWVVAQLVERHNGNVRAWSSQHAGLSGTAFSVFLPIGDTIANAGTAEDESAVVGGKGPRREDPENAFAKLFFGRASS